MKDFKDTPIIELAAIVANHLQRQAIEVVLVGGLAVEIYSENLYLTKDIDMVNTSYQKPAVINQAMAELGFEKKGRVFINETTDICIEFPSAPLSVGDELIKETTTIQSAAGEIPILLATDVIKDRLSAFFHWRDKPSLVQALAVMLNHTIEAKELKRFCQKEASDDAFILVEKLYRLAKKNRLSTMIDIESIVINAFMEGV